MAFSFFRVFWKALTILSGNYFELRHEPSQADMKKISKDLLSDDERIRAYVSKFPDIRRNLARYGYYEKGTITGSPTNLFNREDIESSLREVSWLVYKLREIHYYQIFEPPVKMEFFQVTSLKGRKNHVHFIHTHNIEKLFNGCWI